LNALVQHQKAPARFAADGSIGCARASSSTVSLAYRTAARSAVPKLFRAEPARWNVSGGRPCAIQAR